LTRFRGHVNLEGVTGQFFVHRNRQEVLRLAAHIASTCLSISLRVVRAVHSDATSGAPMVRVRTVRLCHRSEGEGSAFSLLMKRGPRLIALTACPNNRAHRARLAGKTLGYYQSTRSRLDALVAAISAGGFDDPRASERS
jgi:hypothetical protein